jgi:pimeloyl-ACP methyl ester carboxylesterase
VIAADSHSHARTDNQLVVLLHGLASFPVSMVFLEKVLEKEGYAVRNLGYPSTRGSVEDAAARVRQEVRDINPDITVHFVAHSLGNIVVRRMLSEDIPNIGRMVMIAPPNSGSLLAQQLKDLGLFKWIFGQAGKQLSSDNALFFDSLPSPPCEFGIIAGGKGDGKGYNPFLPGDDEGTVTVESTMLEGARDFILLNATHTLILFSKETAEQTVHFLKNGRFKK